MRPSPRVLVPFLLSGLIFLTVGTAGAITFGEVDSQNRYPHVGAIIFELPDGQMRPNCTGTLIAPDVVLTAGHCIVAPPGTTIFVSFDLKFDPATSTLHEGTAIPHPDYSFNGLSDDPDIAVIVLDEPITDISPAELAPLNYLTQMKRSLPDDTFVAVGYGRVRDQKEGGPHALQRGGTRRFVEQEYQSLTRKFLHLNQNPSTGSGGTCFGDSGGPHFHEGLLVSVTANGDAVCRASDITVRVDTAEVLNFLDDFV